MDVTDEARWLVCSVTRAQRAHKGMSMRQCLEGRLVDSMNEEAIDQVVQPKVQGPSTSNASPAILISTICFSFLPPRRVWYPGQYNYVGANAFLKTGPPLALRGPTGLACRGGGIEDAGYLARNIEADAN